MLTVAVVNHGNYLGRGDEYVDRMRSMIARNTTQPYEFVCMKDEGESGGWWAKIELFRPGRFKGRVVYTDLDAVVVGSVDALAANPGIIDLRSWGWTTPTLCSSVMVWDAGDHSDIFECFSRTARDEFRGDQDWITYLGGWDEISPPLCRSYRYHCVESPGKQSAGPPAGCVHVSMHGQPKPHELGGWVAEAWQ